MAAVTYELHALIKEARRRARQRRWTYAGVLALLAGAGIWGGLALTGGSGTIPAPPAPPSYHLDLRFVRLQPLPLDVPGREPARDLQHAARVVVGRLGGATIFAAPRRDGFWRMFSVGKDGRMGGAARVSGPNALRVGIVQVGHGSLFTSRAYLVVAGSALARRDTKLFLAYAGGSDWIAYAGGSRERIKLISVGKPVGAGFSYYVIPRIHQVRGRRATGLELVRGTRLVARVMLPLPYQAPEQPGPKALEAVLHGLGL